MLKNTSLIAFVSLAVFSAHGQTIVLDSWSFTSATPQISDIKNKTMANWDPALAGTSVLSAGVLRDATAGNSPGAWYGDNLGLADSFDSLTLVVDIADINHTDRDYTFEFLGTVGTGNMRVELNTYNGNFSIDVCGNGGELSPANVFNVKHYKGPISMQVSVTWDFTKGTLSYTVSGDGVGYTGTGNSAFSDTQSIAADLSGITNIKQMRIKGGIIGTGEYMDLKRVTISTTIAP